MRRFTSARSWIGASLLWLGFAYAWLLPLVRPRGYYLWGLQLRDVYLGLPLLLAGTCATLIAAAPARSRRSVAMRAITATVAIAMSLLLADATYSLGYSRSWQASPWFDERAFRRQHHVLDPELGYRKRPRSTWTGRLPDGRPYVWRTDENGFRNPLGTRQADLVFIGDSFTEAMQVPVEESFAYRVPRALGRTTVNLGLAGYGPQQEFLVLKRYGIGYRPKQVLWVLFEGNDLTDAEFFRKWRDGKTAPPRAAWQRYLDNSLAQAWLEPTIDRERRFPELLVKVRREQGDPHRERLHYRYEPDAPRKHAVGWLELQRALSEAFRVCQQRGIEMRVLFVPVAIRTMRNDVEFSLAAKRTDYLPVDTVSNPTDFGSQLRRFCRSLGCPFLDTFPALEKEARTRGDLFIPNDEHLDAAGHAVVTRAVVDWMTGRQHRLETASSR